MVTGGAGGILLAAAIAHGHHQIDHQLFKETRGKAQDLGKQVITWTVRDDEARTITANNADQMTFEGFDPREPLTA